MWVVLALGCLMQVVKWALPPFYARKVNHACAGIVALVLPQHPTTLPYRIGVPAFCMLVVLDESWKLRKEGGGETPLLSKNEAQLTSPTWYTCVKENVDLGVLYFALAISTFYLLDIDMIVLAPMFFSDPLAAICGKTFGSGQYPTTQGKTIVGSTAFFVSALVLVYSTWAVGSFISASICALLLALLEFICVDGSDNALLSVACYGLYRLIAAL